MHTLNELSTLFNQALNSEIEALKNKQPATLYEPVIYTMSIGGKRIRPLFLLMAHELFDSKIENAFPAAFAIEMFHNFTLLHDDIMDSAELRRNQPTIHVKYSDNIAILSGDAMSILSYDYINRCSSKNYRQIFDLFTQTALEICEGQQYDMDFESRNDVTVNQYLKMIGLKTAILIAASLKIGALTSDTTQKNADLLYHFGFNLGMAFQLQDDYLDTYGDTESFGKNIGGDIVANKKTFLLLKALELASPHKKLELEELLKLNNFNATEKISRVKAIYNEFGVVEYARNLMEDYYNKAINSLKLVEVEEDKKIELLLAAKKMMNRNN